MLKTNNKTKLLICASGLAILSMTAIGCEEKEESSDTLDTNVSAFQEISLTPQEESAIQSSNTFAFTIFDKINADESGKNIIISPLSISYALSMLLNGAEGETQQQIIDVLNQSNLSVEEINNALKVLTKDLLNVDKKINMGIANSVWTKQGYTAKKTFINALQEYYSAQVKSLTTAEEINNWVNTNTKGMIPELLKELDPDMVMMLINAIYFEGEWASGFNEKETREETFHLSPLESVKVKMMRQTSSFKYFNNENFSIAELPYGQGNYVMDIILPSDSKKINEIIPIIDNRFFSYMDSSKPTTVSVALPRFKYNFNKVLNEILISLGMPLAFSDMADLSGIIEDNPLYVDKIRHVAFIETTEKGSRAAAVTSIEMYTTTSVNPSPKQFIVDKPFVYVIRECSTNTIIFMGKVINPLLEK